MYRGFKLDINWLNRETIQAHKDDGYEIYKGTQNKVREGLNRYVGDDGITLNGSRLQDYWFPQIAADVFISHSHKDKEIAIELAGWLYKELRLIPFIDSAVWGYGDDLLRRIDNKYCLNESKESYDYKKRNVTTSHVHMMVSTALGKMIDNTECLIFLNTPNSTTSGTGARTASPWLFSELVMCSIVRVTPPDRSLILKSFSEELGPKTAASQQITVEYDIASMLAKLGVITDLETWQSVAGSPSPSSKYALNVLYALVPPS